MEPTISQKESVDASTTSADAKAPSNSRYAVLYNASSMFESALAATLNAQLIAALPTHSEVSQIARDLMKCVPHCIIILGVKWGNDLYEAISALNNGEQKCVVITLDARANTEAATPNTAVPARDMPMIRINPGYFIHIAPCKQVVSAFTIMKYLLQNEFPEEFARNAEQYNDAHSFFVGLCASVKAPSLATEYVTSIVNNWRRVMEPDRLVDYGQFIGQVGSIIAKRRIARHSAHIKLGDVEVLVVECPDFETIVRDVALKDHPIVITYSLSGDTTNCVLNCAVRDKLARSAFAPAESKANPDAPAETKANPDAPAESKVNPDAPVETKANPNAPAESKVNPDAPVESKVNPDAPAETKANPDASAETKVNPDAPAESKVNPDAPVESKVNPDAPAESKANPDAPAETKVNPDVLADKEKEQPADYITARDVLALISPRAEFAPSVPGNPEMSLTCATNDFYALIRASVMTRMDNIPTDIQHIVAEGEAILAGIQSPASL